MNNNLIFHSLSVDNFFKDPDFIRKWGLSLDFKPDAEGKWPGERSKLICDIDLDLNNFILSKIFSCHLNFNFEKINRTLPYHIQSTLPLPLFSSRYLK